MMEEKTNNIVIADCEITVTYYFTKGENSVPYYADGSGYPGSPVEIEIISVQSDDFTPLLDQYEKTSKIYDAIEDALYELND